MRRLFQQGLAARGRGRKFVSVLRRLTLAIFLLACVPLLCSPSTPFKIFIYDFIRGKWQVWYGVGLSGMISEAEVPLLKACQSGQSCYLAWRWQWAD